MPSESISSDFGAIYSRSPDRFQFVL